MSAVAIIVVAIAASGVILMRFRKRWLAKINIAVTNRITSLFAGWIGRDHSNAETFGSKPLSVVAGHGAISP